MKRKADVYYVWRRHSDREHLDGYVDATNGRMPNDDSVCTFDQLLVTSNWDEADKLIQEERAKTSV